MELILLLSCALAVNGAALKDYPIEKRQFPGLGGSVPFLPTAAKILKKAPLKPVSSTDLKAERFSQASRKQIVWGPFSVRPPGSLHLVGEGGIKFDRHSDVFEDQLDGICKNCIILNAHYDITDKTGKKLFPKDEIYTHHMIIGSNGGGAPTTALKLAGGVCAGGLPVGLTLPGGGFPTPFAGFGPGGSPANLPSNPFGNVDLASLFSTLTNPPVTMVVKGQEGNAINFMSLNQTQQKAGFWIGANDKIMSSVEVVNYNPSPQDIYLTMDVEYLNLNARPTDYMKTAFAALFAMDCKKIGMHLPTDRVVTYETPEYQVEKNVDLVNLNPHMHDGAANMKLYVNGTLVCNAEAVYGKEGGMSREGIEWQTINHYTPCNTIKLQRGDKLKMTSDYDLRKYKLRPDSSDHSMGTDSMAIAFIQLAHSS